MMGLEAIEAMSREAAQRAAELGQEPLTAFVDGDKAVLKCPKLGDYVPDGWTLKEKLFVDNTGWGSEGEPALTVKQFLAKVKEGLGYAIVEEGQFQVYIGVFEKR